MTYFVGLDLAWTPHRETGVCILELDGDGRLHLRTLEARVATPQEFADVINALGPDVVAAIDAPLIVGEGRQAERMLARALGRHGAFAFMANIEFLEKMNGMAGPHLAEELLARGFSLDPGLLEPKASGRFVVEVYPHAGHVVHFSLDHILAYKKGRVAARRTGLKVLQAHLAAAVARVPLVDARAFESILLAPVEALRGRQLKQLEDLLDAMLCAILAYEGWRYGVDDCEIFGDREAGHIVVPGFARDPRFVAFTSAPAPSSP